MRANALDIKEVRAVVLESTGDISVLHGKDVSPELLEGVSWGALKIVDRKFGLSFLKGGVLNLAPSRSSCVSGFDR